VASWGQKMMMNHYSEEEILEIVAERVRKYTSNESTSVPYNKARQIMSSVLYCMEAAEQEEWQEESKKMDLEEKNLGKRDIEKGEVSATTRKQDNTGAKEAFLRGLNQRKEKIKQTKILYERIRKFFCSYENNCYQDTIISGMESFFKFYDVEFDAGNHILTLDYPLLKEIRNQKGIDLIYEYLYRTELEQRFLAGFKKECVNQILTGCADDHSESIMNICKLVLRNAIGRRLIGKSLYELNINSMERNELQESHEKYCLAELEEIIKDSLKKLIQDEFKDDKILFCYLEYGIKEFAFEFEYCLRNQCLEQLFLETKVESSEDTVFEDGISMEDEELRELIEEMRDIELAEERITLLRNRIKSLADLKEILLECFFEEEYNKVFALLSQEEIRALQEEIKFKINFDEELYQWESELMKWAESIS